MSTPRPTLPASRLFASGDERRFIGRLAVITSLNEAIMLQQLWYWLERSDHVHHDRLWVYNTYDEWEAQLPWWSARTIQRILLALQARGLVIADRFNKLSIDQTKWYTIDFDALVALDITTLAAPSPPSPETVRPSSGTVRPGRQLGMMGVPNMDPLEGANLAPSGPNGYQDYDKQTDGAPSQVRAPIAEQAPSDRVVVRLGPRERKPKPAKSQAISRREIVKTAVCDVTGFRAATVGNHRHLESVASVVLGFVADLADDQIAPAVREIARRYGVYYRPNRPGVRPIRLTMNALAEHWATLAALPAEEVVDAADAPDRSRTNGHRPSRRDIAPPGHNARLYDRLHADRADAREPGPAGGQLSALR